MTPAAHSRADAAIEAGRRAARLSATCGRGCTILPGARVFDTISGEEGVVLHGRIEHRLIPPAPRNVPPADNAEAGQRANGGAGRVGPGGTPPAPGGAS